MQLALFRRRDFGLLWLAGLISMAGDWVLSVAITMEIFQLTGSPAMVSAAVAVNVGTRVVAGTVAGVYVDRWDRRRVLIWANVLLALVLLPAAAITSAATVWIAFPVILAYAALAQFVRPAEHALLPRLVPADQLAAANALNGLNNNLARLVGPAAGGLIVAGFGLRGAALADVASFLVAAALVAGIRGQHRAARVGQHRAVRVGQHRATGQTDEADAATGTAAGRVLHELVDGLRVVKRSRVLLALFLGLLIISVGEGVMGSLFAVFVSRELGGGSLELGWLMSAQAIGGIAGTPVAIWLARRWPSTRMVTVGLALFGIVDIMIFNYPRWFSALAGEIVLFAIVGVPVAVLVAAAITLLQNEVPDEFRGRVFAAVTIVEAGAMLGGTGIAAFATGPFSVVTVLTVQGIAPIVAAAMFALVVRRSVRVETPAGLAPEVTGGDHALEQLGREELGVGGLGVDVAGRVQEHVHAGEVGRRQRTHGVTEAEPARDVEILGRHHA